LYRKIKFQENIFESKLNRLATCLNLFEVCFMDKKLISILILLVVANVAMACRYTVREIGFADFGKDSYHLVLFDDSRISDENAKLFAKISGAALLDANIIVQIINVEKGDTSVFLKYYKEFDSNGLPNVVLVSPEKRAKAFYIDTSGDFSQTVWSLLEEILTSRARYRLKKNIIESYGVVYFIEGRNTEENRKARETVENAVAEIKRLMSSLPKPVNIPPAIITIKTGEIESEDVLLWSLGWEPADIEKPAVALIYGRGRRMGPLLKDEKIKLEVVRNMLRFIGEDCECGLDRSWMLGTMIPLRWNSKLKAGVLKQYGFDAENPLVISEMSQILSIAPQRVNNSINTDLLYGYSENVLAITDSIKRIEPESVVTGSSSDGVLNTLIITLLSLLVIIIAGGIIFVRFKNRN